MSKVETEFNLEEALLRYLNQEGTIRAQILEKEFTKNRGDTNVSRPTLWRKISKLILKGVIIKIKKNEFENFDINDEDDRATYYASSLINQKKAEVLKLLKLLSSGSVRQQNFACHELMRKSSRLQLSSRDLSTINNVFCNEDNSLKEIDFGMAELHTYLLSLIQTLELLKNNIGYGIYPTNYKIISGTFEKYANYLITVITKEEYPKSRVHEIGNVFVVLSLLLVNLSILKDEAFFKLLKKVTEKGILPKISSHLENSWMIDRAINKYSTELLDLSIEMTEAQDNSSRIISTLRHDAERDYVLYTPNFNKLEEGFQKVEKK